MRLSSTPTGLKSLLAPHIFYRYNRFLTSERFSNRKKCPYFLKLTLRVFSEIDTYSDKIFTHPPEHFNLVIEVLIFSRGDAKGRAVGATMRFNLVIEVLFFSRHYATTV